MPARVFQIGFSLELSYEINVPARYGLHLWHTLVERGERHGLCPIGTKALHVLRAERGFIVVGQETDGAVTPADLGLEALVARDKGDFIGKRSPAPGVASSWGCSREVHATCFRRGCTWSRPQGPGRR